MADRPKASSWQASARVVACALLGMWLAACRSGGSATAPPSSRSAGSASGGPSEGTPLQTVRIALSNASSSNAGVYVADGLGYFAREGIRLSYVDIGGGASAIAPALATNRVDVADVGINPAMFNAVAKVRGIKVVADKGSTPKGFGFTSIVVRRDLADKVTGPADFRGLNVALTPPGLATANGYMLSVYLGKGGLTPADVHIQPVPFPEQMAALQNKAVDAAVMSEPWGTEAVNQGLAVRLATNDQVLPNQQIAALAYSPQFMDQHKDLALRFMVAYVRGIRAYVAAFARGTDRDKIVEILAKETPIHEPRPWQQMIPAGLDPDGKLNVQSIQDAEDFFRRIGFVKDVVAVSSLVDNTFVEYADRQLGPAR